MSASFFEQYRRELELVIAEKALTLQNKNFATLAEVTGVQGELRGLQTARALLNSIIDLDE